ncbi:MAG: hypothetical protein IBX50_12200 [Marinospirillum sp.]|uniref:hypothetical protein n=1 Tax=Marinospirillum sp. TaxID=2183934 RepID=UPI0019DB4380|nr:hypothetical protein [Marinospirillum sp.]MBE0507458.1 hypothetical protein [Marinospirillum sp.]
MITSGYQVALLLSVLLAVAGLSWWVAPRVRTVEGFFMGQEPGYAPGVWTLTLSQVTTWIFARSLLNAALLGVFAGLHRLGDEEMMATLQRLLGTPAIFLLGLALIVSAASTLDSTLSSASKLAVVDMGMGRVDPNRGRLVMLLFMLGGLLLVYFGTRDLYAAVAVSGTASLFLTPVIIFCIWMNRRVAQWSFLVNFVFAVGGSVIYFLETSGYVNWIGGWTGVEHNYSKLLILTLFILGVGLISFWWGMQDE